jgi:hypothetical protein
MALQQIEPGVFMLPYSNFNMVKGSSDSNDYKSDMMATIGTPSQSSTGVYNFWTTWTESAIATNTCTDCGISCYNPSASSTYMDMSMDPPNSITDGSYFASGGQAMDKVCFSTTTGKSLCTSDMYQFLATTSQSNIMDASTCGTIGLAPAGDNSMAMMLF